MKKNKQLILSTCIMLACTLLTSFAFANNDTLNTIANDNEAYFYDKARIQNKTRFTAKVTITYPGCKNDVFDIAPYSTGSPKASRGACLITKIGAIFTTNDGAYVSKMTEFTSSGTGASDFAIAENAINEEQTEFECRAYRSNMEGTEIGIKPGFVIHNKINADGARNVEFRVVVNDNEVRIPFGGSYEFTTQSGYYHIYFFFRDLVETKHLDGRWGKMSYRDEGTYLRYHYSGAPILFSKTTEKPTYEITGTIITDGNNKHTAIGEICCEKTNTAGNNMMTSATLLKKCNSSPFKTYTW